MATAGSIIKAGLRKIGSISAGEDPTTNEYSDALEILNQLVDWLNSEKLICFSYQVESLALSSGDSSYTVGTSGDLNTTRPVEILNAYIVDNNITYPVEIMSEDEYAAISDKTLAADWPTHLLFRPTIASSRATVIVWPVQNATRTLKLTTRVAVSSFASTSTTVTLPPAFERWLTNQLAIDLAPEYETEPSQSVVNAARTSLASIKRTNIGTRPRRLATEIGAMFGANSHNITTDEPN